MSRPLIVLIVTIIVFIGIRCWLIFKLSFDSQSFNNIASPIIALIGVIVVYCTLIAFLNQVKAMEDQKTAMVNQVKAMEEQKTIMSNQFDETKKQFSYQHIIDHINRIEKDDINFTQLIKRFFEIYPSKYPDNEIEIIEGKFLYILSQFNNGLDLIEKFNNNSLANKIDKYFTFNRLHQIYYIIYFDQFLKVSLKIEQRKNENPKLSINSEETFLKEIYQINDKFNKLIDKYKEEKLKIELLFSSNHPDLG